MAKDSTGGKLEKLGRLDALSDRDLRAVVKYGRPVQIPAGWSLMWEGSAADKAYLIVEGEVSVRRGEEEIARLGPGEMIGEMSIVNHKLRSATVVALSKLEALHYSSKRMEKLMLSVPAFGDVVRTISEDRADGPSED